MWKLRSRPPALSGQSPPTFTQRIRIRLPRSDTCDPPSLARHSVHDAISRHTRVGALPAAHIASDVPSMGAKALSAVAPSGPRRAHDMTAPTRKPRYAHAVWTSGTACVLRNRDTRAPGGRWPAFVGDEAALARAGLALASCGTRCGTRRSLDCGTALRRDNDLRRVTP